jgi:serine protease Do
MQIDRAQGRRIGAVRAVSLALVLMAGVATAAWADRGAFIGVVVEELSFQEIDRLGISLGVRVRGVASGSPAAEAGVEPNDIIIALDGVPVYSPRRLQWMMSKRPAGEAVKLSVRRGEGGSAEVLDLSLVPESRSATTHTPEGAVTPQGAMAWLGVRMQPIDRVSRQGIADPSGRGVLIADVGADGPAAKAGMQPGDVLVRIDRKEIWSVRDVYRALAFFDPGDEVELEVIRGGEQQLLEAALGGRAPRNAMPPPSAPFGPHNMPRYPGLQMSPPDAWSERREDARDFRRMPPHPRWPSSGVEGAGRQMSL